MIIEWPSPRLAPLVIDLGLINRTRSSGESLTGFEQVADPISTRWGASLQFNTLKRPFIPAWRAMIAALGGRANELRVPVFDPHLWPSDAAIGVSTSTHSDGSTFGDGTLYSTGDVEGITASGLVGVKEITVDFGAYGPLLDGGQYFGIADEVYLATFVESVGSISTIKFEPSLRQTHSGSIFRLRPRMIMRLADDEQGRLPLTRGIIGAPSLELIEVLPGELAAEVVA